MNKIKNENISSSDLWINVADYSNLSIPQYVIWRAVRNLPKLEALALIRGAYNINGGWASLDEAKFIYTMIMENK